MLFAYFGRQHWWPADSRDEIIIGAVLTQNTGWNNVLKAIDNLKTEHICDLRSIRHTSVKHIAALIKPAGFYNQKTSYLKNIADFFSQYNYNYNCIRNRDIRSSLLDVKGIGSETADSILLYALDRPVFVVDAYTKRIMGRHIKDFPKTYEEIQALFHRSIKHDIGLFREYHALLVQCGKQFCRTRPKCDDCPLNTFARTDII